MCSFHPFYLLNFILLFSAYLLLRLVDVPPQELDITSQLRFFCFLGVHALLFTEVIFITKIEGVYHKMIVNLFSSFIIVVAITVCEIFVKQIEEKADYNYWKNDGKKEKLQLTYLVFYFITYILSILSLIFTTLYLTLTEVLIRLQQHKLIKLLNQHLLEKKEWEVKEFQCSICLAGSGGEYVKVKGCGHGFHRQCLLEWMGQHRNCPLCRREIFDNTKQDNSVR